MNFVDYQSNLFPNVSSTPQTILTSTENVLQVNAINICNLGSENIRVNLKKVRNSEGPVEVFLVRNLLVAPYESTELVALKNLIVFLDITDDVNDSLVCFTNGYTQKLDLDISYTILNELPMTDSTIF